MNYEKKSVEYAPRQDQSTKPDVTELDTIIKEFPGDITHIQLLPKNQTIRYLKLIREFKEKTILIRIVEKHKFIDKLLNYLLRNPLLEISYGTDIDRETVEASIDVLEHLVIIDSKINTPGSYILTRNTLLNLVHMLTELPLSQPTLLSQGCTIICTISKNYDGNFIFENLVTNCSLNSFFANLCIQYLALHNMESGWGWGEEGNHFVALTDCCRAMIQLELVYTRHIPSGYARDFTRIYLIILLIPFEREVITAQYINFDDMLSESIWEITQTSGVYTAHLNNPKQWMELQSSELNFLPTVSIEHEYILLRGTVKLLYVLATGCFVDLDHGCSHIEGHRVRRVLSAADRLCDLLKYYKKCEFQAKDDICIVLCDIQKNTEKRASLIDIINYSLSLVIENMIEWEEWNLLQSIPQIKKLLAHTEIMLCYEYTKSGNPQDDRMISKGTYYEQLFTVILQWCDAVIHVRDDTFTIWKNSYVSNTLIRNEFIAFLAENLISSKSYSFLNNSPIFSYTTKAGQLKKPKQPFSDKLLSSILDNKNILKRINSYLPPEPGTIKLISEISISIEERHTKLEAVYTRQALIILTKRIRSLSSHIDATNIIYMLSVCSQECQANVGSCYSRQLFLILTSDICLQQMLESGENNGPSSAFLELIRHKQLLVDFSRGLSDVLDTKPRLTQPYSQDTDRLLSFCDVLINCTKELRSHNGRRVLFDIRSEILNIIRHAFELCKKIILHKLLAKQESSISEIARMQTRLGKDNALGTSELERRCWQQVFYAMEKKYAASGKSQKPDNIVDISHIVEESIANVSRDTLGSVSREVSKGFIGDISICARNFWKNKVIISQHITHKAHCAYNVVQ